MNPSEQAVQIEAAVEGMVLSRNLLDSGGAVLLPAGASLTAASLNSLRRRGVEQLQVELAEAPPDPALREAERAQQLLRLEQLFRHSAASGATGLLLARLCAYRSGD